MFIDSSVTGELLRICRGTMSQTALAKALCKDRTYVSKVETGDITPSPQIVNEWIEITKPFWTQMHQDALKFNDAMAAIQRREQLVMQ